MTNLLTLKQCKSLKRLGFNDNTVYYWYKRQEIKPEIVEKYGNLSDDGFYELTKDCGGDLKFEDVYHYTYRQCVFTDIYVYLDNKNDGLNNPNYDEFINWLVKEHKMILSVSYSAEGWYFELVSFDNKTPAYIIKASEPEHLIGINNPYRAKMNEAIEWTINFLEETLGRHD